LRERSDTTEVKGEADTSPNAESLCLEEQQDEHDKGKAHSQDKQQCPRSDLKKETCEKPSEVEIVDFVDHEQSAISNNRECQSLGSIGSATLLKLPYHLYRSIPPAPGGRQGPLGCASAIGSASLADRSAASRQSDKL